MRIHFFTAPFILTERLLLTGLFHLVPPAVHGRYDEKSDRGRKEKSAKISKKAFADGSSLKEAALALGYVTEEEYDRWVVAKDMCNVDR